MATGRPRSGLPPAPGTFRWHRWPGSADTASGSGGHAWTALATPGQRGGHGVRRWPRRGAGGSRVGGTHWVRQWVEDALGRGCLVQDEETGRHRGRTRGGPGAVSVGPARASRCAPTCGSPGQRPGGREARRVLPRKTPRPPAGGRGALKRAHGALQGLVHAWPRPLATHGHVVDTASGTGRVRLRGGGASAGAGGFYAVKPARSGWSWPRWPPPWPPWPRGGAAGVGHPPHHRARAGAGPGTEPVSGTGAGVCPGRSVRGVHQRALRGQLAAVAARGARGGVNALGDLGVGDLGAGLQQLPHAFALLLR